MNLGLTIFDKFIKINPVWN